VFKAELGFVESGRLVESVIHTSAVVRIPLVAPSSASLVAGRLEASSHPNTADSVAYQQRLPPQTSRRSVMPHLRVGRHETWNCKKRVRNVVLKFKYILLKLRLSDNVVLRKKAELKG
jgi:hypothetical protein